MILAALCECVREDRAELLCVLHSVLFQLGSLRDSRERSRGKDFENTHTHTHKADRQTDKMAGNASFLLLQNRECVSVCVCVHACVYYYLQIKGQTS